MKSLFPLRYRRVLWGTAMAACLLVSFILLMTKVVVIASDSRLVTIDPNNKTVTTSNFSVAWSTTNDVEAIISIEWRGGQNLTGTEAIGTCDPGAPGSVEYFGNSYAPPDPYRGGRVLVGGGTTTPPGTTAWSGQILSSGTAQVTINSSSTDCPPSSAGINVETTYSFVNPDDPNTTWFGLQRSFDFTAAAFAHDFRPYMPRLSLNAGYTEVLYPTPGGTLATLSVYDCPYGCTGPTVVGGAVRLKPPWDSSQGWFAIHNPGTLQGVVVKRDPSTDPQGNPITPQLWVDNDGGSNTNVSSFLLISPTGGFTGGLVAEVETLCFYDSSIWTPSLTPPAACTNGAGPVVSLAPASLTFAPQQVGTFSAPQQATLTNTGGAALNITSVRRSGDFYLTCNCRGTLQPGASCTMHVTFTPTSAGARSGDVFIKDNAPGSPQKLPLSGTGSGTGSIILTLSPPSLDFGSVMVGSSSSPQTVTVTNMGTVAASFVSPFGLTIGGADPHDFEEQPSCGTSLAPNQSCTVAVTFKPTVSGARTGLFVVRQGAASVQIPLSGTGT